MAYTLGEHTFRSRLIVGSGKYPSLPVQRAAIDQAKTSAGRVPDLQLAILGGEVGDLDLAFHHLQRAIDARDPCLPDLAVAPQWDPLRADPRFRECLSRMGLGPNPQGPSIGGPNL